MTLGFKLHAFAEVANILAKAGAKPDFIATNVTDLATNGTTGQGFINILQFILANLPAELQAVTSIMAMLSAFGI